jgi:uncharacterized protein
LTRALVVAGLAIVVTAPLASAHVTVNPGEAPKGGFAKLAFRVPNERDDAGTTSVEVNLPQDHPIPNVSVRPKDGWTYQVETRTLDQPLEGDEGEETTEVVSKITWTGGVIQPGQFDEFEVSVGPLPDDADQIMFPTLQTYQGGEVVRWIDEPLPSGEEPEHPAPLLTLVDAPDEHGGSGDEAAGADGEQAAESGGVTVENAATQDDVDSANTLAIIGIVVGALGLLVGGVALIRRRST